MPSQNNSPDIYEVVLDTYNKLADEYPDYKELNDYTNYITLSINHFIKERRRDVTLTTKELEDNLCSKIDEYNFKEELPAELQKQITQERKKIFDGLVQGEIQLYSIDNLEIDNPKGNYLEINIGKTLIKLRKEEVPEYIKNVLENDPDDPDIIIGIGEHLLTLEREEEALECFKEASKNDPDDPYALTGIGKTLMKLEREEEVPEYIEKALKNNDYDNSDILTDIGEILMNLGRKEEAFKCFKKASEIIFNEEKLYENFGKILEK